MLLVGLLVLHVQARAIGRGTMQASENEGPVIGIFTQDRDANSTYIAASYIKYIESAGGRVVPLHYDQPLDALAQNFAKLNGILFPGGDVSLTDLQSPFMVAAQYLVGQAVLANNRGDYFPIWATCMGFQLLSICTAQDPTVLVSNAFDAEDIANSLDFTELAPLSRLYTSISPSLFAKLAVQNLTVNFHHDGVLPSSFETNEKLRDTFHVLSTNVDRAGKEYVSSIEGKVLPFYGVQYHPEKNPFEWDPSNTPHSPDAIALAQELANFFVNESRKSGHKYDPASLSRDVIWNYNPVYFPNGHLAQEYIFDRSKH